MPGAPRAGVVVLATPEALAEEAAARIAAHATACVRARGRCSLALAGGETPRRTYERLAAGAPEGAMPWGHVELFFGDERCVPPDDARSNYAMVRATLLARGVVPDARVHRVRTELGAPARVADDYEALLRGWFAPLEAPDAPTLDVVLLGVGEDGHTASLFPGSAALAERERWVSASEAPPPAPVRDRVTLTLPMLDRARHVLFLCAGAGKRAVVREILAERAAGGASRYPAARVRGREGTTWLLDAAAAGEIGA